MTDTHELTYAGNVDAPAGDVMGPSENGDLWRVVGATYNSETDRSTVTVERIPEDEFPDVLQALVAGGVS